MIRYCWVNSFRYRCRGCFRFLLTSFMCYGFDSLCFILYFEDAVNNSSGCGCNILVWIWIFSLNCPYVLTWVHFCWIVFLSFVYFNELSFKCCWKFISTMLIIKLAHSFFIFGWLMILLGFVVHAQGCYLIEAGFGNYSTFLVFSQWIDLN